MESMTDRYKAAKKAGKVRDIGVRFLKFEKAGTHVLGMYISKVKIQSRQFDSEYNQYIFEEDAGPVKFHLGGAADQEYGEYFQPGQVYRIEFLREEEIEGNRRIKRYLVEEVDLGRDR